MWFFTFGNSHFRHSITVSVEMEMAFFGRTFGTMGIFVIKRTVILVYSLFLIYAFLCVHAGSSGCC